MSFADMTNEQRLEARKLADERFLVKEKEFLQTAKGADKARYRSVPKRLRKQWLDAYNGELSNLKRIKLFCQECVGYGETDQITNCTARGCPLWQVRPFRK